MICSRSLAWKVWTADSELKNNIAVSVSSVKKCLKIASFDSTNNGAYTCGVTEFTSNSPEDVITGAITNYTISEVKRLLILYIYICFCSNMQYLNAYINCIYFHILIGLYIRDFILKPNYNTVPCVYFYTYICTYVYTYSHL